MKDASVEPEGFNAAFNTTTWEWIGDVTSLVQYFYHVAKFPSNLNNTYIVLIPTRTPHSYGFQTN